MLSAATVNPGRSSATTRRDAVAAADDLVGQEPEQLDARAVDADLLPCLAQRRSRQVAVGRFEAAARKADLAGMRAQMAGAQGQQQRGCLRVQHDGHQHRGRTRMASGRLASSEARLVPTRHCARS